MNQPKGLTGPSRWTRAGDALKMWQRGARMDTERMAILHQVWEREAGHLARHWALDGVKRGVLYVRVGSPAAAQELAMRQGALTKALNKYFRSAWIKAVRPSRAS